MSMVCEKIHLTHFAVAVAAFRNFHQSNEFGVENHINRFPNLHLLIRASAKNAKIALSTSV